MLHKLITKNKRNRAVLYNPVSVLYNPAYRPCISMDCTYSAESSYITPMCSLGCSHM